MQNSYLSEYNSPNSTLKKKRNNPLHTEYARLYQKKNNSYSQAFKLRLKLLNQKKNDHQNSNRSFDSRSNQKNQVRLQSSQPRLNQTLKQTNLNTSFSQKNNSEYYDSNKIKQQKTQRQFIKIEGEEDDLVQQMQIEKEQKLNKEQLIQEYKKIMREIQKVKINCQFEQRKVKNAQALLKQKKKLLIQQKKTMPKTIHQGSIQSEQIIKIIERQKLILRDLIQKNDKQQQQFNKQFEEIQQKKQNLEEKAAYLRRIRLEEEMREKQQKKRMIQLQKVKKQQVAILQQRNLLDRENKQLIDKLNKMKSTFVPPFDIHKKYLEQYEKIFVLKQINKVQKYLKQKEQSKHQKKYLIKLKQQLNKKKSQNDKVRKQLDKKKEISQKLEKKMKQKASLYMQTIQKSQQLDLKK